MESCVCGEDVPLKEIKNHKAVCKARGKYKKKRASKLGRKNRSRQTGILVKIKYLPLYYREAASLLLHVIKEICNFFNFKKKFLEIL